MSDYVLNSASVADLYFDAAIAQAHLAMLLRGLALLDAGSEVLPSLRLNIDPWLQPLVAEPLREPITLGQLAHSFYETRDHDLAAFFDSLNRSIPSDHALDEVSVDAILRLDPQYAAPGYEQTLGSVQAAGVDALICAAMNFTLVGLLRSQLWNFDRMGFVCGSQAYLFDHLAEPTHAEAINARRIEALRSELTARTFWSLKGSVFPHLLFGLDVREQLKKFSTVLMPLMFKRLAELDARAMIWRTSPSELFPEGTTEIKKESLQTMKRYGSDRSFRGHDGMRRTFEDHLWIERSHRMHLFLNPKDKSVEIGYVGKHLPTIEYPT